MSVLNSIRAAMRRHAAFVRTRDEIAALPRDIARDLGIFPEDADRIAYDSVYGR